MLHNSITNNIIQYSSDNVNYQAHHGFRTGTMDSTIWYVLRVEVFCPPTYHGHNI